MDAALDAPASAAQPPIIREPAKMAAAAAAEPISA
jgi:hypothetical protein